jgi:arsenate reductase (glutaredoxin)
LRLTTTDSRAYRHLPEANLHNVPPGLRALKESGVDFEAVDYYTDPIPKEKLKELLRKMGLSPRELLRTKEPIYKTLRIAERDLAGAELIDLMARNPDLIQRPIVEHHA